MSTIDPSEITPEHIYYSRRAFMRGIGALAAGALMLNGCGQEQAAPSAAGETASGPGAGAAASQPGTAGENQPDDAPTPYEAITKYNNY